MTGCLAAWHNQVGRRSASRCQQRRLGRPRNGTLSAARVNRASRQSASKASCNDSDPCGEPSLPDRSLRRPDELEPLQRPSFSDTRLERLVIPSQPSLKLERGCENVVAQCTFPHDCNTPAGIEESASVAPVTLDVGVELRLPEFRPRGRGGRISAMCMPMPEAAVDETHGCESTKHQIGGAGKPSVVQAISESTCVESPAQDEFGYSVSASDCRHHARTGRSVNDVRHLPVLPEFRGMPPTTDFTRGLGRVRA